MKGNPIESNVFYAFLLLILWAPLPLGSNRPWAWHLLAAGVLGLVGLYFLARVGESGGWGRVFQNHLPQIFLLFLWLCYPLVQLVPLHPAFLEMLSPATWEVYRFTGQGEMTISLDRGATWSEWFKYLTCFGGAFLTLVLTQSRERLAQLAWTLLIAGVFQAAFGLFVYFTKTEVSWWFPNITLWAHGTFINRNHFAGLLEMTIPIGLGLLIGWMRRTHSDWSFRDTVLGVLNDIGGLRGVVTGLTVLMFLALFLSQSRAGNASLLLSLLFVAFFANFRRRKSNREKRLIFPILALSLVAGVWFGLGHLTGRIIASDFSGEDSGRLHVYNSVMEKVGNFPLVGTGSGAFRYTFPLYRSQEVGLFYEHAHSDPLEVLSDQGAAGFALLGAAFASCWLTMARAYLHRRDPFARGMLFASLAGTLSLLAHGLVDFNFQIPSNAFFFWILLAMGLQAVVVPHKDTRRTKQLLRTTSTAFPSHLGR